MMNQRQRCCSFWRTKSYAERNLLTLLGFLTRGLTPWPPPLLSLPPFPGIPQLKSKQTILTNNHTTALTVSVVLTGWRSPSISDLKLKGSGSVQPALICRWKKAGTLLFLFNPHWNMRARWNKQVSAGRIMHENTCFYGKSDMNMISTLAGML